MAKYELFEVDKLYIPEPYQRDVKPHKIERMLETWDDEKYDPIHVNVRNGEGRGVVFKGQHRYLTRVQQGKKKIGAWVHRGLTPQQEALYFASEDEDRDQLHPVDKFKALVFAQDETAVGIQRVLDEHDFFIGLKEKDPTSLSVRNIAAVGTVYKLYEKGVLSDTLALINELWRDQYQSTDALFVRGIGILLESYGHRVGAAHKQRLAKYTPEEIIKRSKPVRPGATNGKTRADGVAIILHKIAKLGGGRPNRAKRERG
jgi:hypothetical protein